ncbi:hypothetical protein ABPG72_010636 [Tetrahymena utriculariae]
MDQQYLDIMVLELNPLMPPQAFYFFPKETEIKIGVKEKALRRIFQGQVEFDEYEKSKIEKMKQYLVKHNVVIPEWWEDGHILRFLYANQFKNEKTLKTIKSHSEWRQKTLPIEYKDNIEQYLMKGVFYMHGRDHRYRPIIIIDVSKINVHEIKIEEILESMTYFFEFILKYAMLPGQIENWVVIMNLNKIGVSSLPISALKSLMTYLSSHYRSRMFATYVINTPTSIFLPWSIIKGFLEEATIQKINFSKDGVPEKLFKHTHKSQVEQKFGGTAPNTNEYWPPKEISSDYQLSDENKEDLFISQKQYYDLWEAGRLKKNIVCQNYLQSRHYKVPMNHININILENSVINLSSSNLPNRSNINFQNGNDVNKSIFYRIDSAPKSQVNRSRQMSESIGQMIKSTFNQQQMYDSKDIDEQSISKDINTREKKKSNSQASIYKTNQNEINKNSLLNQKNAQISLLSQEFSTNNKVIKEHPQVIQEQMQLENSQSYLLIDIPNEGLNVKVFTDLSRSIKNNYREGKSVMSKLNNMLNFQG